MLVLTLGEPARDLIGERPAAELGRVKLDALLGFIELGCARFDRRREFAQLFG